MTSQELESECFLCGSDAVYRETDYANRRFYSCKNQECGEYEISRTAMKRLERNSEFKEKAMPKAKECRETDKILEIIVTAHNEVSASFKQRSAGPG